MSYAAENQTDIHTDRQTNKQTEPNILPRPTASVGVGNKCYSLIISGVARGSADGTAPITFGTL